MSPVAPPVPTTLLATLEATWPPAARWRIGAFTLRDGRGGGKRVSAASAEAPPGEDEIARVEREMRDLGQRPLVRLCEDAAPHDRELDALLARRGYKVVDPTVFYCAPLARLLPEPLPVMRVFAIWPPLAIQRDIWTAGGIGPARQAVMARAPEPRCALMARQSDRVAGTAFIALHGVIAMLHAMEVTPALRRQGAAGNLLRGAAQWAGEQGAQWLALAVTRDNAPARALYATLGMEVAGSYHYREHPGEHMP